MTHRAPKSGLPLRRARTVDQRANLVANGHRRHEIHARFPLDGGAIVRVMSSGLRAQWSAGRAPSCLRPRFIGFAAGGRDLNRGDRA